MSKLLRHCNTVDKAMKILVKEYWKTRPLMCMDHRFLTRVMENNALMEILGLSNPCVTRETKKKNRVMIINRDWVDKGLPKGIISDGSTGDEIAGRMETFFNETTTPTQHWCEDDLNFDQVAARMNEMGKEVYGEK